MLDKLVDNPEYYYTFSNDLRKCTKYSESCIDIGSLLNYFDKSNEFDYNTYYYRQAINKLIAYTHIGKEYINRNCLGLTLYCPDSVLSLYDLENARNTVFSPYWLKFIERMSYRRVNKNMDGFQEIHWEHLSRFYEYTIRSNFNFLLGKLPDGNYSYSFNLNAANGLNYLLDLQDFEVKNNNLVSK